MRPISAGLFLAAWSIAMSGAASAATISLQITVATTIEANDGICTVRLSHLGDEPAAALETTLELASGRYRSNRIESLEPGSTAEQEIRFPLDGLPAGQHHGILHVTYADLNGLPFTALAYARVVHGEVPSPTVLVRLDGLDLGEEEASLTVSVSNLESSPVALELRLVLPRELSAGAPTRTIELEGRAEREERFAVRNFSALVGSRYPVFAVADYELDGLHASSLVTADIYIAAPPRRPEAVSAESTGLPRRRMFLILGLVAVLVFSVAVLLRRGTD